MGMNRWAYRGAYNNSFCGYAIIITIIIIVFFSGYIKIKGFKNIKKKETKLPFTCNGKLVK